MRGSGLFVVIWLSVSLGKLAPAEAQPVTQPAPPTDTPAAPVSQCAAAGEPSIPGKHACEERRAPATDNVPDVASLKTPESPAFMALGVAPSEIQRPSTPTGLKASLANGFVTGGALPLLQNFALEFSPYWLFPHRKLSYEQVLLQPARAMYRNFSVSLATSPLDVKRTLPSGATDTTTYGRFAAGARTTLFPGVPTRQAKACVAYIKDTLLQSALAHDAAVRAFEASWTAAHPAPQVDKPVLPAEPSQAEATVNGEFKVELWNELQQKWSAAVDRAYAEYERAHTEVVLWAEAKQAAEDAFQHDYVEKNPMTDARFQRCLADIHAREGFMAELAFAYAFAAPRGNLANFSATADQTTTGWLTMGYVFEDVFKREMEGSVLSVTRLQKDRGTVDVPDLRAKIVDFGGRLALAYQRFGVAIESTRRWRYIDKKSPGDSPEKLWRVALSLDYRLTGGVWLTGTFGKDFGGTHDKPVLALANFQWNFDLERGVVPDKKVTQ